MRGGALRGYLTASLWALCLFLPLAAQSQQAPANHIDQPSASEEAQDPGRNQDAAQGKQTALSPNVALFALSLPGDDQTTSGKPEDGAHADKNAESEGFFSGIKWTDAVIALFTIILGIYTARLYYATQGLWDAAKAQGNDMKASIAHAETAAKAAIASASVARDTLIASHRPWLKVNVSLGDQPLLISPGQASASVAIFAQNTGNTPALHVSPHAWMLIWRTEPGMDPYTEHERRCKAVRDAPPTYAFTLFPEESFPAVARSEMWMLNVSLPREALDAGMKAVQPSGLAMLLIGGCVDYGSTSSPGQRHQTQFLYDLRDVTGTLVSINREVTPPERLALRPMMNGYGNSAN